MILSTSLISAQPVPGNLTVKQPGAEQSFTFDYENASTVEGRGMLDPHTHDIAGIRPARLLRELNQYLPPGRGKHPRLLEVGCGAGRYLRTIQYYRPDCRLYGCDYSEIALNEARQTDPTTATYLRADVLRLPYASGSFDGVVLFDLLEHLNDPITALDEIERVLKPGGFFHAFIPCEGNPQTLFALLGSGQGIASKLWPIGRWKRDYIGHIQQLKSADMLKALAKRHLKVVTIEHSFHLVGQIYDVVDYWTRDTQQLLEQGKINPLKARLNLMLCRLIRFPLWRLAYYEDILRRHDSRAVGLHLTAHKRD